MAVHRVTPAAVVALQDALATAYWYKKDLRAFLRNATNEAALVAQLDWSDYKRNIVGQFVTTMAENQHRYFDQLVSLAFATSEIDPSNLQSLDDGNAKYSKATEAIARLRQYIAPYRAIHTTTHEADERRRVARAEARQQQEILRNIELLRLQFTEILRMAPQTRGYQLEELIVQLLAIHDIDTKGSFRTSGEQIDGAFTFEGTEYLIEAKWQRELTPLSDLASFAEKVRRRLDNTLGLFVSISGFQPTAVERVGIGNRNVLILADGYDLTISLEGRIRFDELLRRKKQHAARTGEIMLRAADLLQ